jgi:hypothetical protein
MHGICKPFQVNFHVLPFKEPSKYFSFCETVFSSWGRSGRICYLPYCFIPKKKKKKKIKEKRHSSMVCESWWAPDGIGQPWFVKGKVGRSAKLYKRAQMCQSLSQNLLSMEDSKNPIASR